jgi:hypothetical protein
MIEKCFVSVPAVLLSFVQAFIPVPIPGAATRQSATRGSRPVRSRGLYSASTFSCKRDGNGSIDRELFARPAIPIDNAALAYH